MEVYKSLQCRRDSQEEIIFPRGPGIEGLIVYSCYMPVQYLQEEGGGWKRTLM